ncbi:ankyrin-1-like, partial [Thraustotheca clavata]
MVQEMLAAQAFAGNWSDVEDSLFEQRGGDINGTTGDMNWTTLTLAASQNKLDIVLLLLQYNTVRLNQPNAIGNTALHEAAKYGHLEIAQALVHAGANVNKRNQEGMTPLHKAAKNGYLDVVRCLLDAGAIPTMPNLKGDMAFAIATESSIQDLLITRMRSDGECALRRLWPELTRRVASQSIVDINAPFGRDQWTLLSYASMHNQIDLVDLLLCYDNIDINLANADGMTPLHEAAKYDNVEILVMLLQLGACTFLKNKDGLLPIQIASSEGQSLFLCTHLLSFGDIALRHNWSEIKRRIRQRQIPDINEPFGEKDWTLLSYATLNNEIELVELLLRYPNIDIDRTNQDGMTPLHEAAKSNWLPLLAILLHVGASTRSKNVEGQRPMDIASIEGRSIIRQIFLASLKHPSNQEPAEPDIICPRCTFVNTKLDLECGMCEMSLQTNNSESVEALKQRIHIMEEASLCCICDERVKDTVFLCGHETCMDCALQITDCPNCRAPITHQQVARYEENALCPICLIKHKNTVFTCGHEICMRYALKLADCPICRKPIVARIRRFDWTALALACKAGQTNIVSLLIAYNGVLLGKPSKDGKTPLHVAAKYDQPLIVQMLIDSGANVNAVDKDGRTPLHEAAMYGCKPVVFKLLQDSRFGDLPVDVAKVGVRDVLHMRTYSLTECAQRGLWSDVSYRLGQMMHVDLNIRFGESNWTLLSYAVINNKEDIVETLLSYEGINVNLANNDGMTPLHEATQRDYLGILRRLLQGEADTKLRNNVITKEGKYAFDLASTRGKEILQEYELPFQYTCPNCTYINASDCDSCEMCDEVIEVNTLLNHLQLSMPRPHSDSYESYSDDGDTQTCQACTYQNIMSNDVCEMCGNDLPGFEDARSNNSIENPIQNTNQDIPQTTPQISPDEIACPQCTYHNPIDGIECIICGAQMKESCPIDLTELSRLKDQVAQYEEAALCPICLEESKNTVFTCGHETCMECAVKLVNCPTCRKPIVARIRRFAMGDSMADLALSERWDELEGALKSTGTHDINATTGPMELCALSLAARHGQVELVNLLLHCNDVQVNKESRDRSTPLHEAARNGHLDVMQALVSAGAELNAKNKDGWTPLHEAARNGHLDIVKSLLAAGANPQLANKNGDKPFAVAKRMQVRELLRGRMLTVGECALHGKWNEVKRRITNQTIDDINEPFGARDWTLLSFTVWYNQVDLVDLILGYRN